MGDLTTEYKIKIGKILALIGCLLTIFVPLIGLLFLGLGISTTYKQETLEMKHVFYINLIGLISSIIILILTIVTASLI